LRVAPLCPSLSAEESAALQLLLKKSGLVVAPAAEVEDVEEESFLDKLNGSGNKAKTFGALYKQVFKANTAKATLYLTVECTDTAVESYTVRQTWFVFNGVCFTPRIPG
jgi:hypothetical protein